MLVDFNKVRKIFMPCMYNGSGMMSAYMHMIDGSKILISNIHPEGSIGLHGHIDNDDINYVISGEGLAICDGVLETLSAGCCHICPRGSAHSIINTRKRDLVLLTVVVERDAKVENN